jgi:hypothetical protein
MLTFILWLILLAISWPLAILALIVYPVIWILMIPLRLFGIAVDGLLGLIKAIITLPLRVLRMHKRSPSE